MSDWIDYETGQPVTPPATNVSDAGDWEDYKDPASAIYAPTAGAGQPVATQDGHWVDYDATPRPPIRAMRRAVFVTHRSGYTVGGGA